MKADRISRMELHKVFLVLLFLLSYPVAGFSLENERWNTGLYFHFVPPGARALGMGGAFVGLADDATAAVSNPAGLAQLTRMQLAIEGRYFSQSSTSQGFEWNEALPNGPNFSGAYAGSTSFDNKASVSFGAFTTPLFNNFFNLAVYYTQPMSFGSPSKSASSLTVSPNLTFESQSSTDISLNEAGLSLAKSFCDDKLMLGFGVGLEFFDMTRSINRYEVTPGSRLHYGATLNEEDSTGVAWHVGILGKPIDNLRLGISYTAMPSFDYTLTDNIINIANAPAPRTFSSKFNIPDYLSFGAAYNILPNWAVIFEGKYIWYSQLMNDFQILYSYGYPLSSSSEYSISNAMEIHFGTEYVLDVIKNIPIALRTGFYYEPSHDLKYNGPETIQANLFNGGDSLWHYAFGVGAVFWNHFQVDVGADFTSQTRNVTLSMVYQF
jgi:long-chain fatty acid transport protein